jgi:predicted RNase H-like nuclease (RuvC/YqgF family)
MLQLTNDNVALIISVLAVVAGPSVAFIISVMNRKKDNAETVESLSQAAAALVNPLSEELMKLRSSHELLKKDYQILQTRISEMQCKLDERDKRISSLEDGVSILNQQVRTLGEEPHYKLPRDFPQSRFDR